MADSVGQEACFGSTPYCLGSSWLSKMLSKIGQAFRERVTSKWPISMTATSPLHGGCPVLTGISLALLGVSFPIWKREGWPKQKPGIGTQVLMPLEHTGLPTTKEGSPQMPSIGLRGKHCRGPLEHVCTSSASSQTLQVRTWNTISMSDKELTEVFVLG